MTHVRPREGILQQHPEGNVLLPEHQEDPHNTLPPTVKWICQTCALHTTPDDWKVGQQVTQELG